MAENDAGRFILRETGVVLAGEAVCIALMLGVFALLGRLDRPVWIGAAVGLILALGNFFMMAVSAGSASERAAAQDVKGGKQLMRSS